MYIKNALKVGDILYRVDPRKLSVKTFVISSPDEIVNHTTTTYENFSLQCEKQRFQIPLEKLPCEFKGLWYFISEDEANNFVKAQLEI